MIDEIIKQMEELKKNDGFVTTKIHNMAVEKCIEVVRKWQLSVADDGK